MSGKNKKILVLIRCELAPYCVPLRFHRKWWKKRIGCQNQIINLRNNKENLILNNTDIVAVLKNKISKDKHHHIIREIKI